MYERVDLNCEAGKRAGREPGERSGATCVLIVNHRLGGDGFGSKAEVMREIAVEVAGLHGSNQHRHASTEAKAKVMGAEWRRCDGTDSDGVEAWPVGDAEGGR